MSYSLPRTVGLALCIVAVGCADDSPQPTDPVSINLAQALRNTEPKDLPSVEIDYPEDLPDYFTDDSALIEAVRQTDGRVLVSFKNPSTLKLPQRPRQFRNGKAFATIPAVSADNIRAGRLVVVSLGGVIRKRFTEVRSVAATIIPESAPALRAHPLIDNVTPSWPLQTGVMTKRRAATVRRGQTIPSNIQQVRADLVWLITSGAGRTIVIIDTGTDGGTATTHEDLPTFGSNMCLSTIGQLPNRPTCADSIAPAHDFGHGTGVGGVALALNNTLDVVGVAPSATHKSIKVFARGAQIGHAAESRDVRRRA